MATVPNTPISAKPALTPVLPTDRLVGVRTPQNQTDPSLRVGPISLGDAATAIRPLLNLTTNNLPGTDKRVRFLTAAQLAADTNGGDCLDNLDPATLVLGGLAWVEFHPTQGYGVSLRLLYDSTPRTPAGSGLNAYRTGDMVAGDTVPVRWVLAGGPEQGVPVYAQKPTGYIFAVGELVRSYASDTANEQFFAATAATALPAPTVSTGDVNWRSVSGPALPAPVAPLYGTTGTNTNGAMTQAASTAVTGLSANLVTADKSSLVAAVNEVSNNNLYQRGTNGGQAVLKGYSNVASNYQSAVVAGEQSTASGGYSVVAGGFQNTAGANDSVIVGGRHNATYTSNPSTFGAIIGSDTCVSRANNCFISNSSNCSIAVGCDYTTLIGCSGLTITTGTNQTYINNVLRTVAVQATATTAGVAKLYAATGSATDGAMTQAAITAGLFFDFTNEVFTSGAGPIPLAARAATIVSGNTTAVTYNLPTAASATYLAFRLQAAPFENGPLAMVFSGGTLDNLTTLSIQPGEFRIIAKPAGSTAWNTVWAARNTVQATATTLGTVRGGGTGNVSINADGSMTAMAAAAAASFASLTGAPADNANLTTALNAKQAADTLSVLPYAASIAIDFNAETVRTLAATGNVAFAASVNVAALKTKELYLSNTTGAAITLTFPAWSFFPGPAPTSLAAGKQAVLTLRSLGTTDATIKAAYVAQA